MTTNAVLTIKENTPELIPVTKWNDYFPYPTVNAIRMLMFRQKSNGFYKVLRKLGHRNYISVQSFNEWVNEQNKDRLSK